MDGVFFQLPPSFMAFMEPVLSEIAEHGIFSPIEPESFFLLSNEPYLFHVLNRKDVPIPRTMVFADLSSISSTVKDFSMPCMITAYHGAQRIQSTRCENLSSLQSVVNSLPTPLDCIMMREQPTGAKVTSITIGENVFSAEFSFNSQKNEFEKKGRLIRLGEAETYNVIQASRAVGLEIATIETIDGKIVGVSSMVGLEEMSQITSQNLFGLIAQFLVERCGGE
ncbi:hypothetical protein KJ972_03545 [Candidatus Micrarchaeota archaeon]|nr:hypothetical protein [Candidatus Micrarchaeota archaeon]